METSFRHLSIFTVVILSCILFIVGCYCFSFFSDDQVVSSSATDVLESSNTTIITVKADYSAYGSSGNEVYQAPALYTQPEREGVCDLLRINQEGSTFYYSFTVPEDVQHFILYPAVLSVQQEGNLQVMDAAECSETSDCIVKSIEITSNTIANQPTSGCVITFTLDSKRGWYPEQLVLNSENAVHFGTASVTFTNTSAGMLLNKYTVSYEMNLTTSQATEFLQNATLSYGIKHTYQYAVNATYSLPTEYSLEVMNAQISLEE